MADEELNEELEADKRADWGKTKYDYYYTDYVDHDYPTELNAKEHRLAAIEQEEALRIQRKLLSTIDDADISGVVFDEDNDVENLIETIENQNRDLEKHQNNQQSETASIKKKRKVTFTSNEEDGSQEEDFDEEESDDGEEDDDHDHDDDGQESTSQTRQRRPINSAIKKNRGLTPYKNKKYRNPRVKHRNKFNKVMIKRRRNVKEYLAEYNRYSGEATGIKMSTVKSIKLS